MSQRLTFLILGCGGRGVCFADELQRHPEYGVVVGVADPDSERRDRIGDAHCVSPDMRFTTWEEALERPRMADVVINTLMDRMHAASAIRAIGQGYHMLLEKPMATTLDDCMGIESAQRKHRRVVAVCHSLRYSRVFAEMIRLLRAGAIGDIVSLDQLEGVETTHQAHSFVRGNWGNESRSTFMLMAKSCHDIDAICHAINKPCLRVNSFGSLTSFRPERAPTGSPLRCTDGCPVERACPYSAFKLYVGEAAKRLWYARHAGLAGLSETQAIERLQTSPYGRCVYHCDNDVVDHQVVAMEFAGGATATFTMTAFTPFSDRWIRVHGTEGFLKMSLEERTIDIWRYRDGVREHIDLPLQSTDGHGGADFNILAAFVDAVRRNDPEAVLTGLSESLRTHAAVFAAEKSRIERRQVDLAELLPQGD